MERSRYRAQRKFGRITIPRIEDDAAFASGILGENIGAMMALVDRAVVLNPWKMASAWRWAGPHERPNPL